MKNNYRGKHLVILGAARQGLALAKYLSAHGAIITVTDRKDEQVLQDIVNDFQEGEINWVLGGHPVDLLDGADYLSLSGGVPLTIPLVKDALLRGVPLTNDSQIFLEIVPCPVIGITGSAGKTTTTILVGKMAAAALGENRSWVGGNIGNPLISDVDQMKEDHIAVMELSSFQLEQMDISPKVACIVNITPNHLDRHGTMEAYTLAKARILAAQSESDIAVLNREDPGSWGLKDQVQGKLISFGRNKPEYELEGTYLEGEWICYWDGKGSNQLIPVSSIRLRGAHNQMNVLAACAIAISVGFPAEAMLMGVEALEGVPHRLEPVRNWGGADWVNDSKATTPKGSIAALNSFHEPLVLLAGGRDKNLPWQDFSQLVLNRVRYLILFGEAADLIEDSLAAELDSDQEMIPYRKCSGLKEAVSAAAEICEQGDVVLLSPGGTSFDEFIDFEERGEKFRLWVNELN
jgi:UDP-N-acetylmuramoylalanine--D-glutamate ligase